MAGRVFSNAGGFALALAAFLAVAPAARADVVVPDDYPTIQAAIDAQAGPVHVRTGVYDEVLRIESNVVIDAYADPYGINYPQIKGLTIPNPGATLSMTGFRLRQAVTLYCDWLRFESCRFDSGLTASGSYPPQIHLRGCTIYGGANLRGMGVHVLGCTIIGGGLFSWYEGEAVIVGNYIAGPAPWGVWLDSSYPIAQVRSNVITGTDVGIIPSKSCVVTDNDILNCRLDGIAVPTGDYHVTISGNRIRDCGRSGIYVASSANRGQSTISDNRIERPGVDGISVHTDFTLAHNVVTDAGRYGILADTALAFAVHANTVLRARGDGMQLAPWGQAFVDSCMVGHCGGDGLVLTARHDDYAAFSSTVYANQGSGIVVLDASPDVPFPNDQGNKLQRNLAYGNGRYGLEWKSKADAHLGCNDYYANTLGMTAGVSMGPCDMSIEPLLCDMANDDVGLRPDSPLLHAPGCLLVGARGVGCAALAAVPGAVRAGALAFAVGPRPASGEVRFAWTPQGLPVRLELFDLAGARHLDETLDGARAEYRWSARAADGRALPAGVYYARLTAGSRHETSAVVIVR